LSSVKPGISWFLALASEWYLQRTVLRLVPRCDSMSTSIRFFVLIVEAIFTGVGLAQSPTILPATQASPPEFSEESSYDADLAALATSESIEDLTAHPVKSLARVTRALLGHDSHGHKIFQIELTIQSVWASLHITANKPPSFSFDEEIGPVTLLYFCCLPPSGVLLSRGQERKFLLFFQLSDGYSGEDMFFHVKNFPPILNAQWRFRHPQ